MAQYRLVHLQSSPMPYIIQRFISLCTWRDVESFATEAEATEALDQWRKTYDGANSYVG